MSDTAARNRARAGNWLTYLPDGTNRTRVECPNANCKSHFRKDSRSQRSATPYRSTATGQNIDGTVYVKCRHQNSCGYNVKPAYDVVVAHNRGEGIQPDAPNWTPPPPPKQSKFYEYRQGAIGGSPLDNFCMSKFGRRWTKVVGEYGVLSDGDRNGFQYTNEQKLVAVVKWMRFRVDGHLITKKSLSGRGQVTTDSPDDVIDWPLFGGHLIEDGCDVAIVEAEDTALMMRCVDPSRIWCAVSGKGVERFREFMLKFPRCDYELFPDIDAIDSWTNAGKYLRTHDLRVAMNEWWKVNEVSMALSAMDDSRRQKADLKDYLLESMR